jgi:hypothetical protein
MTSSHESIDTSLAAEVVEFAIGLIENGKVERGLHILRTLHERLLQDDGMHHKACTAEACGDHFVTQ